MHDSFKHTAEHTAKDWAVDALVAFAAFVACGVHMLIASSSVIYVDTEFRQMAGLISHVPNLHAYFLMGFTTLPLVFRRVAPWAAYGIVLCCFVFCSAVMGSLSLLPVGPVVAVFTLASSGTKKEAVAATALAMAALLFAPLTAQSQELAYMLRFQNLALVLAGYLAGVAASIYKAYLEEAERRLEEAERGQEELAARRVAEERTRIAREVHDITAHSLSAVAIQAAAAERLMDTNPQAAKEAVADIRAVSKASLEEIRSLVSVLRDADYVQTAPAEGTERMEDIVVDYLRKAGLEVDCSSRGYSRQDVPAFVDMALFSLAREAATNTVRHANASHVTIVLRSTASRADLQFSDDGAGMAALHQDGIPGHGLRGMRERIEALNGTFIVKSAPSAGCTLEASIPLEAHHDAG